MTALPSFHLLYLTQWQISPSLAYHHKIPFTVFKYPNRYSHPPKLMAEQQTLLVTVSSGEQHTPKLSALQKMDSK